MFLATIMVLGSTVNAAPRSYDLGFVTHRFDEFRSSPLVVMLEDGRLKAQEALPYAPIYILPWQSIKGPPQLWKAYHKIAFLYDEVKVEPDQRSIIRFVNERIMGGTWMVLLGQAPLNWFAEKTGNPHLTDRSPPLPFIEYIAARCERDGDRTICGFASSLRSSPLNLTTDEDIISALRVLQFSLPAR